MPEQPPIDTPEKASVSPELRPGATIHQERAAPLTPGDVCSRRPDVVWSAVDGEAVLLDLAGGYYFSLNRVGAVIWELLDGERTLGAVQQAVCGRFEAAPETVWADLEALVQRLCAGKLATMAAASRE